MKYLFTLIICGMIIIPSFGQLNSQAEAQQNYNDLISPAGSSRGNTVRTFDSRFKGVKGHPFLYDAWMDGSVKSAQGKSYSKVPLKFDLVENTLVIKTEKGYPMYMAKPNIESFSIGVEGKDQLFEKFNDPKGGDEQLFMEIVSSGKVKLLKYSKKYFIKANTQDAAYNNQVYSEFQSKNNVYYLEFSDHPGILQKVKRGNGGLVKQLGNEIAGDLKDFLKKNKLMVSLERDMLAAIGYVNSR